MRSSFGLFVEMTTVECWPVVIDGGNAVSIIFRTRRTKYCKVSHVDHHEEHALS